jgi:hypothetical protein
VGDRAAEVEIGAEQGRTPQCAEDAAFLGRLA